MKKLIFIIPAFALLSAANAQRVNGHVNINISSNTPYQQPRGGYPNPNYPQGNSGYYNHHNHGGGFNNGGNNCNDGNGNYNYPNSNNCSHGSHNGGHGNNSCNAGGNIHNGRGYNQPNGRGYNYPCQGSACNHNGCNRGQNYPIGMNEAAFHGLILQLHNSSFDSDKLSIASQAARYNALNSLQIAAIMREFSFESSRLDFAIKAYNSCYDPQNYFMVNSEFQFSSSIAELERAIY